MTVKIGSTEFAKGTSRSEPCQVQGLEGARQLRVVPLTRSSEPGVYDHGNVSHTLTLTVTRHHDSAGDALDYILDHASSVFALSGDVTIESPSGNAWTLSQGKVERAALSRWAGKSTTHSYVLRGGNLVKVIAEP